MFEQTRATVGVKLRLLDSNTKAIFDLCRVAKLSTAELMEIGGAYFPEDCLMVQHTQKFGVLCSELVIYAAKFNEASEVRRLD